MPLIIRVKKSVWDKVMEIFDRAEYMKAQGMTSQLEIDFLKAKIWDLSSHQVVELYHWIVAFTEQMKAVQRKQAQVVYLPSLLLRKENGEYEIKVF